MEKIWLPPIDTCCKEVYSVEFVLADNLMNHCEIKCTRHGTKFVENPLKSSKLNVIIRPSGRLKKIISKYFRDRKAQSKEQAVTQLSTF